MSSVLLQQQAAWHKVAQSTAFRYSNSCHLDVPQLVSSLQVQQQQQCDTSQQYYLIAAAQIRSAQHLQRKNSQGRQHASRCFYSRQHTQLDICSEKQSSACCNLPSSAHSQHSTACGTQAQHSSQSNMGSRSTACLYNVMSSCSHSTVCTHCTSSSMTTHCASAEHPTVHQRPHGRPHSTAQLHTICHSMLSASSALRSICLP